MKRSGRSKFAPWLWMAVLLSTWVSVVEATPTVQHQLTVEIDPAQGTLEVHDVIHLPAGAPRRFRLNAGLSLRESAQVRPLTVTAGHPAWREYALTVPVAEASVSLHYQGKLLSDRNQVFDDARVAADQVVLGPAAAWYPDFGALPVRFEIKVKLPAGWTSVSQGEGSWEAPTARQQWRTDSPQEGIYLIAAPFTRYARDTAWGRAEVYLLSPDEGLAREYLDATAEYVRMYSRLLGAYPYEKFALVENVQQTGYGMPSFTLLGSRVIRLPFIVHTSYPHEILHNWWGNGVWVDYRGGNWAEALTTYLADYLLAEQRGKGSEQRRAALQKYADFVAEHNDFPLSRFRARHGEASQAVGYSKGMMFFHMLRRQMGDQAFVNSLRRFFARYRFSEAGFGDLRGVFEQETGLDLRPTFDQWLERTGAPQLVLADVQSNAKAGAFELSFTLRQVQPGEAFTLRVPVAVQLRAQERAQMRTFIMETKQQRFHWTFTEAPQRLAIDPQFELFRRLDTGELPASLGRVQGAQGIQFVLPAQASRALSAAYRALAQQWAGPGDEIIYDTELNEPPHQSAWILGRDNRWARWFVNAEGLPFVLREDRLRIGDQQWSLKDHGVVVVRTAADGNSYAWVSAADSGLIAALARKIPHYSRYSYLVFDGSDGRNLAKGEWPVSASPLQYSFGSVSAPLRLPVQPPLTALIGPGSAGAP